MGNADIASRWAPRYMAWMALGGTLKRIPQDIIHQVEATKVFGQRRPNLHFLLGAEARRQTCLKLAAGLCAIMLPDKNSGHYYDYAAFENGNEPQFLPAVQRERHALSWRPSPTATCGSTSARNTARLWSASTAWSGFCAPGGGDGTSREGPMSAIVALYYGDSYPADAPVLDPDQGHSDGDSAGYHQTEREPIPRVLPATLRSPRRRRGSRGPQSRPSFHMPDCSEAVSSTSRRRTEQGSKVMWTLKGETEAMKDNIARWSLRGGIASGDVRLQLPPRRCRPRTAQAVLQPVPAPEVT